MLAHGGNPDAVSEDDFKLVMVALADGFVGNKQILNAIGGLTAGVFNYIRSSGQAAYKLQDIIGSAYDYIYQPLSDEQKKEQANNQLLTFMSLMPESEKAFK